MTAAAEKGMEAAETPEEVAEGMEAAEKVAVEHCSSRQTSRYSTCTPKRCRHIVAGPRLGACKLVVV